MSFRRILIVDDHALIRDALQGLLSRHAADASVLAVPDLESAFGALRRGGPAFDVVLLDLGLPGWDSAETGALEEFRLRHPAVPVVVVSGRDDANIVARCLDAGAMGFVPKNADAQTVIEALRVVADGAVYVPPSAQRALSGAAHGDSAVAEARAREGIAALTPRQRDVLRAMIRGLPNKLIARELELSDNTVKAHVSAVLRAFAARNRTEAVLVAGRLRLRVSDALSDHAPDAAN